MEIHDLRAFLDALGQIAAKTCQTNDESVVEELLPTLNQAFSAAGSCICHLEQVGDSATFTVTHLSGSEVFRKMAGVFEVAPMAHRLSFLASIQAGDAVVVNPTAEEADKGLVEVFHPLSLVAVPVKRNDDTVGGFLGFGVAELDSDLDEQLTACRVAIELFRPHLAFLQPENNQTEVARADTYRAGSEAMGFDDLAAYVAHELSQPLQVISSYAEGLRLKLTQEPGADLTSIIESLVEASDAAAASVIRVRATIARECPRKR